MDTDAVAAQLYRTPPEDFVAERDARVAEARAAGDRSAARAIGACKRPTRAAWLTNLLVDDAPDEVEGFLALAGPLAEAQRSLDGAAVRQVSAQRNRLLGSLARRAAGLGRDAGQRIDGGLEREVRTVLESALADPDLADEVRSGRLVRYERHSGFGPVPDDAGDPDADGDPSPGHGNRTATTADRAAGATRSDRSPRSTGSGGSRSRDAARRTEDADTRSGRKAAEADRRADRRSEEQRERRDSERRERLVAEAEDRVSRARSDAEDTAAERDDARARADTAASARDEARRRADELAEELERARDAASEAEKAAKVAERTAAAAARRAREAEAAVTRAEHRLRTAREG